MSEEIYERAGLAVTRYTGPASEGPDRARWQFTPTYFNDYAQLDRADVEALVEVLARSVSKEPAQ